MAENFPDKPTASLREIIFSMFLTLTLWTSSFTVLFPFYVMLRLSSRVRNMFFAFAFRVFFAERFSQDSELRRRVFANIDRECKANKNRHLRYLEIGVGTGANFPFYTGNHTLTLLDMNPNFRSTFEAHLKKYPNVNVDKVVISMAENMKDIKNEVYDVVVATRIFCSAVDVDAIMKEIKRVLKPGGKLAFMEHVGYPRSHLLFWIQKIASPLWETYFNGCRVDRDFVKTLKKHFPNYTCDTVYPIHLPTFLRPQNIGIATK